MHYLLSFFGGGGDGAVGGPPYSMGTVFHNKAVEFPQEVIRD